MKNNKKTSSSCYYPQNKIELQPFISSGQIDLAWSHSWSKMGPESACSPCHLLGPGIGKESTKKTSCVMKFVMLPSLVWWLPHSAPIPRVNIVSCIPPESKLGLSSPLLDSEPMFQGDVVSVPAVFPACVLLLLSLISGFFCPNVCFIITQAKGRGAGWGLLE